MSETATKPAFLVDAYSDPVLVRLDGRADFHNCACLRDFISEMIRQGKSHISNADKGDVHKISFGGVSVAQRSTIFLFAKRQRTNPLS